MKWALTFVLLRCAAVVFGQNSSRSSSESDDSCYATDPDPYVYFSTKTSYFDVDNEDASPVEIEGDIS